MKIRAGIAAVFVFGLACGEGDRTAISAGRHQIEVEVPASWQVLDQGLQAVIRKGELEVIAADLGPARPEGYRAEVERARRLWSENRENEARSMLEDIRVRKSYFPKEKDFDEFWETWSTLVSAQTGTEWPEIERRFERVLDAIDSMEPAPISSIAGAVLDDLELDGRRYEVKSRSPLRVDGREALQIETWMTLTHTDLRRWLIVIDKGRVLALRHNRSDPETTDAFGAITASLQFAADAAR